MRMNPTVVEKNTNTAVRTMHKLVADASGKLPSKMQLVPSGKWVNSIKGDIEITVADLKEMKANFEKGIGLPDGGTEGAAVDYSHKDWEEAAFWIKKVDVIDGILWATEIEWTDAGAEAVRTKKFKFFSPSFYPACFGKYYDPEDPELTAQNVLVGGGLTNIPFFKGLTGLKASTSASAGDTDSTIFINADTKQGVTMDFDTARTMKPAEVAANEEAKKVLADNKDKLTAAEVVAFGLDEGAKPTQPVEASTTGTVSEDDQKVLASIKSGEMKLVKASEYADLESKVNASTTQLEEIRKEKVAEVVKAHVARGAIKADQSGKWEARILADATLEEDLKALPDNKLLASEIGDNGGDAKTAKEQFDTKVAEKIKASAENGQTPMLQADAISAVRKEDPELAKAYDAEVVYKTNQ